MPQINLNSINDSRPHSRPYPAVDRIASTEAVIVTLRTPCFANSFTTTGLNKMRINRLMDSKTPIHTTGISITSAYCGKNGYKNASPKPAKDKVNDEYRGYFKPAMFTFITRNMQRPFLCQARVLYRSMHYRHHCCIRPFQAIPVPLCGQPPYRRRWQLLQNAPVHNR